ncbi:MAG: chemotaxis protein CheW [Solirubrobacteraceae bacterium]
MSDQTDARQLVVFTLGAEQYALPIKQVQEIIRYKQPRSFTSTDYSVRGVISLRGRIIPVHDLASRLGVSSELSDQTMIMILETAAQTVGVIVDAVDEVLTVQADQLEQLPAADTTLMDSIAKLGDRLVVLLNPSTLFAATSLAA